MIKNKLDAMEKLGWTFTDINSEEISYRKHSRAIFIRLGWESVYFVESIRDFRFELKELRALHSAIKYRTRLFNRKMKYGR